MTQSSTPHTTEEITERAALYAVGGLGPSEARDFEEHLDAGCAECVAELRSFDVVVEQLAWDDVGVTPSVEVRDKLLARVALEPRESAVASQPTAEASPTNATTANAGLFSIRAGARPWEATEDDGVFYKQLFNDEAHGLVTSLVRMSPGARVPKHRHKGIEQCLVLEGDLRTGDEVMTSGDFICAMPGTVHQELTTEQGNLLLIIAPESYEVLRPVSNPSA
ncbi:MAG TPA: cupin domain-containing protein [Pyrinomonadaceae bacterium]|jgi:anti-sigma factor ChrR (cupin superfamily)|nr:cupin domain-containing protein [Pyrinomonadaceae bacterium]